MMGGIPRAAVRPGASANGSKESTRYLILILAVALLLRVCFVPILGLRHPDELWQYLEPAHKIVFDRSVQTWEFRVGMRSWLLPAILAGPMWIGSTLAPGTLLYLYLPKVAAAALSLAIPIASWKLGARISHVHALIAAFVTAVWIEFVDFGSRTLSEPIATALVFPAAYLLTKTSPSRQGLFLAGLLLGLAFATRYQFAPALAVLVLGAPWQRLRETLPLVLAGGLAALAIDASVNLAFGQVPLGWISANFHANLIENRSSFYGVMPAWGYAELLLRAWLVYAIPILILAAIGARRFPVLFAVAIINLVAHSLIPHKEYRFIFLTSAILLFLAAIGTADVLARLRPGRKKWVAIACAAWLLASLSLGAVRYSRGSWTAYGGTLAALHSAGNVPGACGLAVYQIPPSTPRASYTLYHRDTEIFAFEGASAAEALQAQQDHFNVLISTPSERPPLPAYRLVTCHSADRTSPPLCVYARPGTCRASRDSRSEINNFLKQRGQ
jgi:phosphatidylinositol glycan class B